MYAFVSPTRRLSLIFAPRSGFMCNKCICVYSQDWQSLLVFHSANQIGQKGAITRIASGCSPEQETYLKKLYRFLWPQYGVHFTPDFKKDPKTGRKYDFYNKPYGLQHFLSHHDPPLRDDVVIALIDPDQLFLRPITSHIKGDKNNLISRPWKVSDIFEKVETGRPAGQTYGLGAPWVRLRLYLILYFIPYHTHHECL